MNEIFEPIGVTPMPKAAFDNLSDEDKLGWEPLANDPSRFIPKGFKMVTQGLHKGRAVSPCHHSSQATANQTCEVNASQV